MSFCLSALLSIVLSCPSPCNKHIKAHKRGIQKAIPASDIGAATKKARDIDMGRWAQAEYDRVVVQKIKALLWVYPRVYHACAVARKLVEEFLADSRYSRRGGD
jgi:hypothetical protein